ncbi:MAG: hypothetical protein WDN28_11510 [Chthoniobacter sp.]
MDRPWGWHLTSILIHAGAVALFFTTERLLAALAERLSAPVRMSIALGVAVVWAIHPLQTSAVTYVAGRADRWRRFSVLQAGLRACQSHCAKSSVALAARRGGLPPLAMLSKESGIIFLPLWLLILAWRAERDAP